MKTSSTWLRTALLSLGAFMGLAIVSGSAAAAPREGSSSSPPPPNPPLSGRVALLDKMLLDAGLPPEWRRFFLLTAKGESNFTANVFLGREGLKPTFAKLSSANDDFGESEFRATVTAYDRNVEIYEKCPWPKSRYTVAGGLFGQLAPNAVFGWKGTDLECIDPWSIFVAAEAIPMAIEQARRTLRNSRMKLNGDWLDLRVGWGSISNIGIPDKRTRMRNKLIDKTKIGDLGIPESFLFEKVSTLPKIDPLAVREQLLAKFGTEALAA